MWRFKAAAPIDQRPEANRPELWCGKCKALAVSDWELLWLYRCESSRQKRQQQCVVWCSNTAEAVAGPVNKSYDSVPVNRSLKPARARQAYSVFGATVFVGTTSHGFSRALAKAWMCVHHFYSERVWPNSRLLSLSLLELKAS